MRENFRRVVPAKTRHDVDIAAVFLIDQGVHAVHQHVEARPVVALAFGHLAIKIQHLTADADAQRAERPRHRAALVACVQKRRHHGIDHAHDVVIGAVQPRQALGGQVVGDAAIDPAPRGQIGLRFAMDILRHQGHGRKHPRHRAGGHDRAAHEHGRRGDRIEQPGALMGLGGRDGDADLAPGLFVGLLEGQIGDQPGHDALQIADIDLRRGA